MSISASAIEKASGEEFGGEGCLRRYAWTYLHGLWEEIKGDAAEAGTRTHKLLEDRNPDVEDGAVFHGKVWKKDKLTGIYKERDYVFPISEMAKRLAHFLPDDVEQGREVKFTANLHGIEFKGVIDGLYKATIVDFKTTGADLKYAKTPTKLKTDVQRLVYSEAYPDRPAALWITGSWPDPELKRELEVKASLLNVDRSKDRENFKLRVLQPAEQMLALAKDVDPLSLPLPGPIGKNGKCKACEKFPPAGCPFQDKCFPAKKRLKTLIQKMEEEPFAPRAETPRQYNFPVINELTQEAEKLGLYEKKEEPVKEDVSKPYLIENLYIDCFPLSTLDVPLEYSYIHIAEAGNEVCADMGVLNPNLIDFGKGPHMVTAQLIANLEEREAPIKHFFLETRSAEGRNAMQALSSHAKNIVKGCY